ncbi:hypothetical protein A8F94_09890 [Bacillus sp. FJAT-27225]|uniref:DUF1572 family protein n=1 Tax=Bacillus sp. FJAT-27225 TaxID=1743144 RepID=UPI00080C2565|nr:DUF1572 family protein [Bacillus sp. FJAT-27225]OCA88121.1 hypothetical protein A8F94_09890 [Bacillus sp. FJAT-27225]
MNTETKFLKIAKESFKGMKAQAERAMDQLSLEELHWAPNPESNSIAILVKHMSGNLKSRFSSFLTEDGEKPDRKRDEEFVGSFKSKEELLQTWNTGWNVLFETLEGMTDDDLARTITIRSEPYSAINAIQRAIVHQSGHVGQIVYIAKMIKHESWKTLSIARGQSEKWTEGYKEKFKR